jgi:hypothetical protein
MGAVFVLAADYLLSVSSRRRQANEGSQRLGIILVSVTLGLALAQTVVDIYRGFNVRPNTRQS